MYTTYCTIFQASGVFHMQ